MSADTCEVGPRNVLIQSRVFPCARVDYDPFGSSVAERYGRRTPVVGIASGG